MVAYGRVVPGVERGGDRLVEQGDASADRGHVDSACEAYLRATTYCRTSYGPLVGSPVDDRRVRPVLDYALACSEVAEDRVVLAGWSLGAFWPRGRRHSSSG